MKSYIAWIICIGSALIGVLVILFLIEMYNQYLLLTVLFEPFTFLVIGVIIVCVIEVSIFTIVIRNRLTKKGTKQIKLKGASPITSILSEKTITKEEQIEKIVFTAAYPGCLRPEKWYSFLIYLHLPRIQKEVQKILDQKKPKLGFHPSISTHDYGIKMPRGTVFKFVPSAKNLTFNPDSQTVTWLEDYHKIEFRIKNKSDTDAQTIESGFVDIFVGEILVAQIPFSLKIGYTEDDKAKSESTAHLFNKIFISYAHKDKKVVDYVIACYKALGIEILIDKSKLESGHPWKEDLREMIDIADIFQLYWSYASKESKSVEKEWQYALGLESLKSEYFIRPFYWEKPMPTPPDDLKHLHFATLEFESKI